MTRPRGSVLVFDFDSDMTVVDAPDPALVRRIAEFLDAAVPHPWTFFAASLGFIAAGYKP